jgi:phage repressor protein C with HTH and peptisase S24 domain
METVDIQETRRERLRRLIEDEYRGNVSRFGQLIQKSQSQLSSTLLGRKGFGERLARQIETALGLSPGWLDRPLDDAPSDTDAPEGFVAVRRVRMKLSAGVIGWAIECHADDAPPLFFRREWFERRGFRPDQLVALKVEGSSMEPGLYAGDTIVVNRSDTQLVDGEVFAVSYEGELVIKRLRRDAGEWFLASDNPDKRRYGDKRCADGVEIIGRVVYKNSEHI